MNRIDKRRNSKEVNSKKTKNSTSKTGKKKVSSKDKQNKKRVKQEPKKKGCLGFLFGKLFFILFMALIMFAGLFTYKTYQNGWGFKGALITALGYSLEEVENLDSINVLLLGISEDLDSRLTDTIIVCSYNPKIHKVSMISIPRDTFIGKNKEEARSSQKINVLFNKSPEKLLSKIEEITGLKIDNYIVINNDALIKIVDVIGGVDFDIPIDMNYDDPTQDLHIHLSSGYQRVRGIEAEQLLRFRHNNDGTSYPGSYGDNDFGRMKTQRLFISSTIKQSIDIKNLLKINDMINIVKNSTQTNMDYDDLMIYIPTLIEFDSSTDIISNQLPGESEKCNGYWFFIHDKSKTNNLIYSLSDIIK